MTRKEFMLERDLGNWLIYAVYELRIDETEATLEWYNHHNIGKKLICTCKGYDPKYSRTRMYIRNVTNIMEDAFKKEGWWNIFTLCNDKVDAGLYMCEVIRYYIDRNGYINAEVKVITVVDDVKFHVLFSKDSGTWNSSAWWLMMVESNAFLKEYDFSARGLIHSPNIGELQRVFPQFQDMNPEDIGKKALMMYINQEITMEEIERCLDTPSKWEQLLSNISSAVSRDRVVDVYGADYPLFASKVSHNVANGSSYFQDLNVEEYLVRQLDYYKELVSTNKITAVDTDDVLSKVESALAYRKSVNDAKKAAKKAAKRDKNVIKEVN